MCRKAEDPDREVHVIPLDEDGNTAHLFDSICWCEPLKIDDFTNEGGSELWMHRKEV